MKAITKKRFMREYRYGYIFLAPFLILFFVFMVIPIFVAFFLSFTNYNMLQSPVFTGIENYKMLLLDDKVFLTALKNTLIFALITGPVGYFCSFIFAWVINELRFRTVFALAFYAPSITNGIAMSVIWLYFFSGDRYGMINNVLINIGIISEPIQWTMDANYILGVVIFISIWMSMGTGFLVFLAGFQNINKEYYEAGAIDGIRNKTQELRLLTLPMMKPQLLFGAINALVNSFGVFDVAVSVAGMPSPNYAAHTIVAHLYDYAFIRFQMGYASAVAMVLFLITFVIGRGFMKLLSSDD